MTPCHVVQVLKVLNSTYSITHASYAIGPLHGSPSIGSLITARIDFR